MALITPPQYCYPYFFDEDEFRQQLEMLGLTCKIEIDNKTKMFKPLAISGPYDFKLSIDYFFFLMFDLAGNLLIWKTDYDTIFLSKVFFDKERFNKLDFNIDLRRSPIGKSELLTDYGLKDFVTYVRLNNLKYDLDYFEKFVVISITGKLVNIVPLDCFNKTGGDYGYVWPATAQIDFNSDELFGKGMRMADFRIKLNL